MAARSCYGLVKHIILSQRYKLTEPCKIICGLHERTLHAACGPWVWFACPIFTAIVRPEIDFRQCFAHSPGDCVLSQFRHHLWQQTIAWYTPVLCFRGTFRHIQENDAAVESDIRIWYDMCISRSALPDVDLVFDQSVNQSIVDLYSA